MGGGGHKNAAGFEMVAPEYDEEKGITVWGIDSESLEPIVEPMLGLDQLVKPIEGTFPEDPAAPDSKSPEYFNEVVTSLEESTEETESLSSREEKRHD